MFEAFERDLRRNAPVKVLPFGSCDQPRRDFRSLSLAGRAQCHRQRPSTTEWNQAYLERDLVAGARAAKTAIAIATQYLHSHPRPRGRSRDGSTADQRRSDLTRKTLKTGSEFHKQPVSDRNFVTRRPVASWPRSTSSLSSF